MNLQSSTLKIDESGKPFHIQQAEQIQALSNGVEGGGARAHAAGVGLRSIFELTDDRDRVFRARRRERGSDRHAQ